MLKQHSVAESINFALSGIYHAFRDNRNVRIHFAIAALVIITGIFLGVSRLELIILLVMIILVMSSEMINTSIEEMTNLITSEHRREAEIAKDVAAGTVLVTSIGAAIVGVIIFLPYVLRLI